MSEWHTQAESLKAQGMANKDIADVLGVSYGAVKTHLFRKGYRDKNTTPIHSDRIVYEGQNWTFEVTREVDKANPLTPTDVLIEQNMNIDDWDIVSFTQNQWQGQGKNGQIVDLCQAKLTVRPKKDVGITFEDIDEFLSTKEFKNLKERPSIEYNEKGDTLEIDIADLHCGLLAWRNETGKDYDLHICANDFLDKIDEIVKRSRGKQFKDIYLCSLGDIIHVDNDNNTTTKGTMQQVDGRIAKIFDFAFDVMNTAIDWLRPLGAKIHYVYLCGNHDRNTGYYLAKCLQLANKDVDFDIDPRPQKAIHFGQCLIGLSHGDMPNKNKGVWLLNDYRKEYGESQFVEEHCGHIHTEEAKKYNNVLIRSVMAMTGASYWESQQGYRSQRGVMCFVWNDDKGLREIWYSNNIDK